MKRNLSRDFLERLTPSIAGEVISAVRREVSYSRGEPKLAVLFLTYRCTSRCRTCKMWLRQWDLERELSADEWLRTADILTDTGVHVFELFGGDVLLRKDVLFPLIRRLKEKGAVVHIPTNSRLLDEEAAQSLVASKVDYLYLSTDGVEAVHDQVRGVKNSFALVQRAVEALVKCRAGRNIPRLICNTTVSKFNVDSLEEVANFAAGAGFDEIDFEYVGEMTSGDVAASAIDGLNPTPYFLRDGESVLVSPAQAVLLKTKLRSITRKYMASSFRVVTVNIDCLSLDNLISGSVPKHKCYTERCEVTVDPGGNIVACPFFHSFAYGNVLERDFRDIWLAEKHERFHRLLNTKGLPMCRQCIPSVQRSQSFSDRLERIYLARVQAAQKRVASISTHA